jgi:hypothetical protein
LITLIFEGHNLWWKNIVVQTSSALSLSHEDIWISVTLTNDGKSH